MAIEMDALGKLGDDEVTVSEAARRWCLQESSARVLGQRGHFEDDGSAPSLFALHQALMVNGHEPRHSG